MRDVGAVEDDLPRGRLVEPQERAADRRLAAARLADQPERLAALDRERDAVDRLHVPDVPVHHDPAPDREPDLEVLDLDERVAAVRAHAALPTRERCHSSAGTGLKQAHEVARLELLERRHLLARLLDLEAAARRERALGRRAEHVPRRARDRHQPLPAAGVEPRDALQQPERVGVPRPREEPVGRAGLHEHAGVHHVHALAHARDDAEVVRDQDERRVEVGDEGLQQLEDLRLDRDVERGRRLVGDQELRLARERHRDHRALAHSARELVRVVLQPRPGARDPDLVEQLRRRGRRPARGPSRSASRAPRGSAGRSSAPGSARSSGPGRSSRSPGRGSSAAARRPAAGGRGRRTSPSRS